MSDNPPPLPLVPPRLTLEQARHHLVSLSIVQMEMASLLQKLVKQVPATGEGGPAASMEMWNEAQSAFSQAYSVAAQCLGLPDAG